MLKLNFSADLVQLGSQVFLWWNAPRYFIAFATHLGFYTLLVIVIISLRYYLIWENKKRDNLAAAGVHQARDERMLHAWEDLTDKENINFHYVSINNYQRYFLSSV